MRHPVFELNPATYVPHRLHDGNRDWPESNCYIDLYIGVLNGLGLDVYACLPFTLASNFEGDHFTFFKPPLSDLDRLYGLNVQELTLWRPLLEHIEEHVETGRLVSPEVDSYYLPDTRATDYQQSHVKTTISIIGIDCLQRSLKYFHNAGLYELSGDDFDGLFHLNCIVAADYLPPYCELLNLERVEQKPTEVLASDSKALAVEYLCARPKTNPMIRMGDRLSEDLLWLVEGDLVRYHAYVFSTLRQCGANFELAALYLRWLHQKTNVDTLKTAECFENISSTAKMMIMKLARVVNSGRKKDFSANIAEMASSWESGMDLLESSLIR